MIQKGLHLLSSLLFSNLGNTVKRTLLSLSDRSHLDDFGIDLAFQEKMEPLMQFLFYHYFRVDVEGSKHLPKKGPAIIVANHSGTIAFDGGMLMLAIYNSPRKRRDIRALVDDFVFDTPLLGGLMQRVGTVRASQANAQKLLENDNLVIVFPEGLRGVAKTYDQRYQLQRFGRGGFIRLAMQTGVPIIPAAIVGAEEVAPLLWRSRKLGRAIGMPYVPFTVTFPWLGPLGFIPLPSKWKISFAKAVPFHQFSAADADDEQLVQQESDKVRHSIRTMLDRMLAERKDIWLG